MKLFIRRLRPFIRRMVSFAGRVFDVVISHVIFLFLIALVGYVILQPILAGSINAVDELRQSVDREQRLHEIIAERDKSIQEREELIQAYQNDGNVLRIVNYNPCIVCHGGCVIQL